MTGVVGVSRSIAQAVTVTLLPDAIIESRYPMGAPRPELGGLGAGAGVPVALPMVLQPSLVWGLLPVVLMA